jgi:hypothetical protein
MGRIWSASIEGVSKGVNEDWTLLSVRGTAPQ